MAKSTSGDVIKVQPFCFCGARSLAVTTACYILGGTCILFGLIRVILIPTWGRSALEVPQETYEAFRESYVMPGQGNRVAECDASKEWKARLAQIAGLDNGSSLGLLWLEFSAYLLLVLDGIMLVVLVFCMKTLPGLVWRLLFIVLLIASCIMVICTFAIFYPTYLINKEPNGDDTVFGILSIVVFCIVYLILFLMCKWLFPGTGHTPGPGTGTVPNGDGESPDISPPIPIIPHNPAHRPPMSDITDMTDYNAETLHGFQTVIDVHRVRTHTPKPGASKYSRPGDSYGFTYSPRPTVSGKSKYKKKHPVSGKHVYDFEKTRLM